MQGAATDLIANKDYLTSLDAAIGDGDHGINMARGAQAIAAIDRKDYTSEQGFDAGSYLKKVGMILVSHVGGASGPLYGTFFLRMGATIGPHPIDLPLFAKAVLAGVAGLKARGKAEYAQKTMVDVWEPVSRCVAEAADRAPGEGISVLEDALAAAVSVARKEAEATVDRIATKGRASYLGERSRGTMDPGAASSMIIINAVYRASKG